VMHVRLRPDGQCSSCLVLRKRHLTATLWALLFFLMMISSSTLVDITGF